jgi:hypothetical protein
MFGGQLKGTNFYALYDNIIMSFCTKEERDYFVFHIANKSKPIRFNTAYWLFAVEAYPLIEIKKAKGERKRKIKRWVRAHDYQWGVI